MEISLENLYVDIGIKGLRDLLSKTLGYQKNQYDWFQRSLSQTDTTQNIRLKLSLRPIKNVRI